MDKQWKVVPVDPTYEMSKAGGEAAREYLESTGRNSPSVIYRAMLAAAPQPPSASDKPNAVDLIAAIRKECTGGEVWRVQDPEGAYCLERSRDESFNPERECQEWLADHVKRFPEHAAEHQYRVASTRVYTSAESLALAAADLLAALAPSPGVDAGEQKPVAHRVLEAEPGGTWSVSARWRDGAPEPGLVETVGRMPEHWRIELAFAGPSLAASALDPHPPTRHCMCADCKPSFDNGASDPAQRYDITRGVANG